MTNACPICRVSIPPHAVREASQIAMCVHCRTSFRFHWGAGDPAALPSPSPLAPPRGVSVDNDGHTVRIRYRWYDRWAYFFLAGAVLLVMPAIGATWMLHDDDKNVFMNWLIIVACWVVVGVLGYVAACCFVTTSVVEADRVYLVVRTAPLPWFGGCRLSWDDITALECRFKPEHNPHDPNTATHQLTAMLRSGKRKTLIGIFPTPEHAWFFAEQLRTVIDRRRR